LTNGTHRRRFGRAAPAAVAGVAGGAMLLLAAWASCTVTRENYKTLSFFFDGVPNPDAPAAAVDPRTGAVHQYVVVSLHAPYAEEKCDECHASRLRLSNRDSAACLKCHAQTRQGFERMHGPVAAGACLWCHNPHESAYPHLLRDSDRRLCGQCHTPELLDTSRVPEHADEARACLECHVGHGGAHPFLMRTGRDVPQAGGPAPRGN